MEQHDLPPLQRNPVISVPSGHLVEQISEGLQHSANINFQNLFFGANVLFGYSVTNNIVTINFTNVDILFI